MYWLYASVCVCNVVFGTLFLPETKGKHLVDINREFEEKKKLQVDIEDERLSDS